MSIKCYCTRYDYSFEIHYRITYYTEDIVYHLKEISVSKKVFNLEEVSFINELISSLDFSNILIAEAIINNKDK